MPSRHGRRIFEKPRSKEATAEFLKEFSGSQFQFVTALAVLNTPTRHMLSTVEVSDISFRPLRDRAGAFENDAVLLFADRIAGSYNVGTALPPSRLIVLLREQGVEI
jgi:predicted house-cleaning NTP pyrophosphatase (Maf/HAM1 superfamily)